MLIGEMSVWSRLMICLSDAFRACRHVAALRYDGCCHAAFSATAMLAALLSHALCLPPATMLDFATLLPPTLMPRRRHAAA